MSRKQFKAHCRPSAYLRRVMEHDGNVSEGSRPKLIATRRLLNRTVSFFANGLRFIDGVDITDQEQYDSQILRFAHASILIKGPVGDKSTCYVDATKNPIEVVIYNIPLEQFIKRAKQLIGTGQLDADLLLDEPLKKARELTNERNVKLFGR